MKNWIAGLFLCAIAVVIISAKPPGNASFGAPVSSTGAPGEMTCAVSGCHSDRIPNTGNAHTFLEIENNPSGYIPGETYKLNIKISEAGKVRFGFQVVALDQQGNNAGEFILTETNRTQIIQNLIALTDRRYVTYTYEGTAATQSGIGSWTMNWIAPSTNIGEVKFYVATVSANDDGTDNGDDVFTSSLTFSGTVQGIGNSEKDHFISIFQNRPGVLSVVKSKNKNLDIQIYNLEGKIIENFQMEGGEMKKDFQFNTMNTDGVYLVKTSLGSESNTQKIFIRK